MFQIIRGGILESYQSYFDIDFESGDVRIEVVGDDQVINFKFMIGFFSLPCFFGTISSLWMGETKKDELDGFGFDFDYYFSVENGYLLIKHRGFDDISNYKFSFKRFVEAIDKGFSEYLEEQHSKGIYPLKMDEYTHPLSEDVIHNYVLFSDIIRKG